MTLFKDITVSIVVLLALNYFSRVNKF